MVHFNDDSFEGEVSLAGSFLNRKLVTLLLSSP